jgi:kynurenine formamidase
MNILNSATIIDMTHLITTSSPTWQGSASFSFTIIKDYHAGLRTQQFTISSNMGTHIDAPAHTNTNGITVDQIPLEKLVVPACVLDVSKKANANYRISIADVQAFEKEHGMIPAGCLFIAYTGWSVRWENYAQYSNLDTQGSMHFPGYSLQAAQLLIERRVVGIGIDTFSPDSGDEKFPLHQLLLAKGIYIIENIAQADKLPPTGALVIALPIKLHDAVEAPARVIGIIPKK